MVKNILLIIFLLNLKIFSFEINPVFFDKNIGDRGGYQEYVLTNNSKSTKRYRITALPGDGKYGDMSKWVEVNPKIISVKPNSSSVLKVYIEAPKGSKEGEYSTFLNFKSIPLPTLPKLSEEESLLSARMLLNINIELMGYVGDEKPSFNVKNISLNSKEDKTEIKYTLENKTLSRGVYYSLDVFDKNGNFYSKEMGRIRKNSDKNQAVVIKGLKKNDVVGIRFRETPTNKNILQLEF